MDLHQHIQPGTDRMFLGVNRNARIVSLLFTRPALGKNMFSTILKQVCKQESVTSDECKTWPSNHTLRDTLEIILIEVGYYDSKVARRTGHREMRSLKSYQNLREDEGLNQQRSILGDKGKANSIVYWI